MIDAILWKWPGAQAVMRGSEVVRWDGPMARPSAAEIAQAVADYRSQNIAAVTDVERALESPVVQAMLRAFAPALGKTVAEATALLKTEMTTPGKK